MAQKIPIIVSDFETQLSTAISVGSTTFSISSNLDDDGVVIQNGKYAFTLDDASSDKEYLIGDLVGKDITNAVSISRQGVPTTGAKRAHRVGVAVKITDFSILLNVAETLRGISTLDGLSPLAYDVSPTLSDNTQLATVGYVLSVVTGGAVSFDKQIITGKAGEALTAGNIIYFKESDQSWYKASANTDSTSEGVELGVAVANVTIVGSNFQILRSGVSTFHTGLTTGTKYYMSNTFGTIGTLGVGTNPILIGVALSTTSLLFMPKSQRNILFTGEDTASATDAYTATIPYLFVPRKGTIVSFRPNTSNTGACSLNVNGTGALAIKNANGTDPGDGTLVANKYTTLIFNNLTNTWDLPVINALTPPLTRIFTTSQTYTPTTGLKYAVVEIVGGGGGATYTSAGSGAFSSAGSGAGGGYGRRTLTSTQIGASQVITIGSGGAAGTSGTPNGNAGGNSSFGAFITSNGGSGGISISGASIFNPNFGGTATGGDVNIPGGSGVTGAGGSSSSLPLSLGGSSYLSTMGNVSYGTGGNGIVVGNSNSGSGNNGNAGVCIITEYFN